MPMRRGTKGEVFDLPELRDHTEVFRDRAAAAAVLAEMLTAYRDTSALVLAIPDGGIPVGAGIARPLGLDLDVMVTSKVTFPWNPEAGFGALAFDGTLLLNDHLVAVSGLTHADVDAGLLEARRKVARRVELFRGERPMPDLAGRSVFLVDDGLATGYTMLAAISAARKAGAAEIFVAVPTGHRESVHRLVAEVEALYCPNVRGGVRYAVAEAYQHWHDVSEDEAKRLLDDFASH